jgi:cell division initiation protein
MRGYKEQEVDMFLNEVMETLEKYVNENLELKERLERGEKDLNRYSLMERTLSETLVVAKKTADELMANAQQKAELIIQTAEEEARRRVQETEQELQLVKARHEEARRELITYRTRFRTMVQAQLEMLEHDSIDE